MITFLSAPMVGTKFMRIFGVVKDLAVIASVSVASTWMAATICTSMIPAEKTRRCMAAANLEVSHQFGSLKSRKNAFAANLEVIIS